MENKDQSLSRKVFQTLNPSQIANLKALKQKLRMKNPSNPIESNKENINNKATPQPTSTCQIQKAPKPLEIYLEKIHSHLRSTSTRNLATFDPFDYQDEINRRMRGILFNWLIEVQNKLELKLKTIFIAANIFDRFLQFKKVKRNKLQLVGITAFLIASKYEDIYPPEVNELYHYCDKIYEPKEFLECESEIISYLGFDFVFVSAVDFNELYFKMNGIQDRKFENTCTLILQMFIFHSFVGGFDSGKLAMFSRVMTRKILGISVVKEERLTGDEFLFFREHLSKIIMMVKNDKLNALEGKYKSLFLKLLYFSD